MAESVVPPHSDIPTQTPTTRRPLIDAQSIQSALPYIDAALASLANVPKIGPIAQALRVITGVSVQAVAGERRTIISRMRDLHSKIKELDPKADAREIRTLRTQLDVCVEMLLELES